MEEFDWQQTTAQAAKGDKDAFEMLYKQTEHAVYFTCIKLLANEHDAKDVMQDTYITAFEKLTELSDYSKFPQWIKRIAVNNCKMRFRKQKTDYLEDKPEQISELADESEIIPSDYVSDAEKRHIIMNIVDTQLSDVQRQTVILYYYDEMSVEQIAEIMECPEGTVKYRLSAAREKIGEAVLIYEKENDDKLHAIIPIPVLTSILRKEAEEIAVPKIQIFKPEASAPKHGTGNHSNLNMKGQNTMTNAIKGKIIAGAAAAIIVAGGGIAAAVVLNSDSDKPDKSDDTSISRTYKDIDSSITDTDTDNSASDDNSINDMSESDPRDDDPSGSDSSKRPSKKDGDYPEFDGLRVIKLGELEEDNPFSAEEDLLSGTIKELYTDREDAKTRLLVIDNDGVMYVCHTYTLQGSYNTEVGRDTGIEHFDAVELYPYWGEYSITAIDGNNIFYRVIDSEGNTKLDKKNSTPLEFRGTILDGKKLKDVNVTYESRDLFVIDEDGTVYDGGQYYRDNEAQTYYDKNAFLDSAGLYYEEKYSYLPEGEDIVQTASHFCLTSDGRVFHEYKKEKQLTSIADRKIAKLFAYDSNDIGSITLLTEDNKILTVSVANQNDSIKFEADAPAGNVLDINTTRYWIIVTTDTGYYYADTNASEFKPLDALNDLSGVEVVRISYETVLLSNGYIYDIIFDD